MIIGIGEKKVHFQTNKDIQPTGIILSSTTT